MDAVHLAKWNAMVADFMGRRYVAIHPGYASPSNVYKRALAWRIVVCVLSFVILVFNIAGQVVPYYSDDTYLRYDSVGYGVWFQVRQSGSSHYIVDDADAAAVVAVMATGFLVIALVLSVVLSTVWPKHERERLEDKAGSELAMSEFGRPRQAYGDDDTADAFPYTNLRVMNCGLAKDVEYERVELRRRQYDRSISAATLSMLIFAAALQLVVVALMGKEYAFVNSGGGQGYVHLDAGFALMIVALVLAVLNCCFVALPYLPEVYLCGKLKPQSCTLMVVDDITAAELTEQLRHFTSLQNPILVDMTRGVREALPGPSPQDRPPTPGQTVPSAPRQTAEGGATDTFVPVVYTTSSYYQPPPQLFSVHAEEAFVSDVSLNVMDKASEEAAPRAAVKASHMDVEMTPEVLKTEKENT